MFEHDRRAAFSVAVRGGNFDPKKAGTSARFKTFAAVSPQKTILTAEVFFPNGNRSSERKRRKGFSAQSRLSERTSLFKKEKSAALQTADFLLRNGISFMKRGRLKIFYRTISSSTISPNVST